jgi:hypothetical protein
LAALGLRCTVPRLEAALDAEPTSMRCPLRDSCPLATPDCLIFAPGWYCDLREIRVLRMPEPDSDYEPDSDGEPDDDFY